MILKPIPAKVYLNVSDATDVSGPLTAPFYDGNLFVNSLARPHFLP